MKKPISEFTDATALRKLMANAKRLGRDDVWCEATRRLCFLEAADWTDPLHNEFFRTLEAYEVILSEKNGRRTRASRTRQKVKNKGVIQCLEDWALMSSPTEGFDLLIQKGLFELTGEYLVFKYPKHFSEKARKSAKARLERYGITLSSD